MIRIIKNFIIICLFAIFLFSGISLAARHIYVVEKTKINLRSGPGYEFKITSLLSSGDELAVLDEFENWYKISFKGPSETNVGWILKSLTKEEKPMAVQIADLKVLLSDVQSKLDQINKENKLLAKDKMKIEKINQKQEIEFKEINTKYMKVINSYVIKWVIVGASILLIGIVIGSMYESLKYRQRPGIKL